MTRMLAVGLFLLGVVVGGIGASYAAKTAPPRAHAVTLTPGLQQLGRR